MTLGWQAIDIPADSLFGLDNLPYGVFAPAGAAPRVGVRVADWVVELSVALGDDVFAARTLNPLMALAAAGPAGGGRIIFGEVRGRTGAAR
jgi:fumarylacetoacetase